MTKWPVKETIRQADLEDTGRSVTDVVMQRKAELGADWYRIDRHLDTADVTVTYHSNTEEFPDDVVGAQQEEKTE